MVKPANGPVKGSAHPAADTHAPTKGKGHRECLARFLKWLTRRHQKLGGVTEVRAIAEKQAKMVWSGYFDPEHFMGLVQQIQPDPEGPRPKIPFGGTPLIGEAQFYFNLQPARKDLLARSAYTLGRCEATSDKDIIAYNLFPVDLDPVRSSGISATDKEKREARKVAAEARKWLKERGVCCITADSGNGYHLLVPTTSYLDVAWASANARTLLQFLDKKFSTDKVKIDTTVYNPGRIFKLYGTKAIKGSDLPERPHRWASVDMSKIPKDVDLFGVLKEELDAFREASEVPESSPKKATHKVKAGSSAGEGWNFDTCAKILDALLTRGGFEFKAKVKDGNRIFNFKDCPHHTDPDGQHYECAVMARGVGGFGAKCFHDEEAGWKDFKPKVGWEKHIGGVLDELGVPRATGPYQATPDGIVRLTHTKEGVLKLPLTNFTAQITKDVSEDDGVESRRVFEIEAELRGRTSRFTVPAQDFAAMNWPVEHLGAQAVVYTIAGGEPA